MRRFTNAPKDAFSLDLHVLGPPLTFALSQDQTLQLTVELDAELVLRGLMESFRGTLAKERHGRYVRMSESLSDSR